MAYLSPAARYPGFVPLTRPDGSAIWFGDGLVIRPSPTMADPRAKTEIIYGGVTIFVRESPEEVVAAFCQGEEGMTGGADG